jgi:hypothetical protein
MWGMFCGFNNLCYLCGMEDNKKSPNKIKVEEQIFWLDKNRPVKWSDIKDLQLEDDDVIISQWTEDEDSSYWHGEITRMVEETDEQFEKRQKGIERDSKWAKERRYESYLKLKKEFDQE